MTVHRPGSQGVLRPAFTFFLLAYVNYIVVTGSSDAVGSDASGYLNRARLFAAGALTTPLRGVPGIPAECLKAEDLTPLGFRQSRQAERLVPYYPIGLPLHLVAASWIVGWNAAGILVNVVASLAALTLLYLLGRRLGLPTTWAAACTASFGLFPVTVRYFNRVMSDGVATAWCIAAVYCVTRSRDSSRWTVLSGACFGVAVLVRPTNALLLPALLLALPRRPAAIAAFLAGGMPSGLALGAYNLSTYGSVAASGYTDISDLLAWSYFLPRIEHFALWISRFLTPVPLLLWLGSLYRCVRGDRIHLLLNAWLLPIVGFYAFYYYSLDTWWYLRFILPALPPLLLAGFLVARGLVDRVTAFSGSAGTARAVVLTVLVGVFAAGTALSLDSIRRFRLWTAGADYDAYPRAVAWLQSQGGPRAAVIAKEFSGAVYFYGDLPIVRYDLISQGAFKDLCERTRGAGTPLYAMLLDKEVPVVREKLRGSWQEVWHFKHARILKLREDPPSPAETPPAR